VKRLLILAALLFLLLPSFGCGQKRDAFDGQRAFAELQRQVNFGPRYPGSPGHDRCLDYLVATLRSYTDDVRQQSFTFTYGPERVTAKATNVIARFGPGGSPRLLLCAHWDTRPWADHDPDPANRKKPILGANDGASGVAVLLELARVMHARPPREGVVVVLFDAEDEGVEGNDDSYAIGSKVYAERLAQDERPEFGILLDMVGDADLNLYQEGYSLTYAKAYVDLVWQTAQQLGYPEFIPRARYYVVDDHVRLLRVGVPCIDIIDFDYPYWHTLQDTPDKCSPESLQKVGRVLEHVIYEY